MVKPWQYTPAPIAQANGTPVSHLEEPSNVPTDNFSVPDYHLNITTSSGKAYVMAKPHHIDEAVKLYPWGVVFDSKNRLITMWGDVPETALLGKHDLATGEPLIPEMRAA